MTGVGGIKDTPCANEVRRSAVAGLEESLCLFRWKHPWGIRLGDAVHSASKSDAERPIWVYLGSCETSVCLLIRVASVDGRGSNLSLVEWRAVPSSFSSVICAELMVSSETCDVCGREPASAVTKTKSGALWSPPISFADFRMAACTS